MNLSDLAAKGAVPAGMLLGLGLPADWSVEWLEGFVAGLAADLAAYGCPLLGGDTVKVPGPLTLSVTAFGRANRTVRRRGARPGDLLCVTGTIGDGALGLVARQAERDPQRRRAGLPRSARIIAATSSIAISSPSRASPWPRPWRAMPRLPWTCRMASSATSPR